MQKIKISGIPTNEVLAYQTGALDVNGMAPEVHQEGGGPCRHCLTRIKPDEAKLVLAYRPFEESQPYAEVGPIFLHTKPCSSFNEIDQLPQIVKEWDDAPVIVRGYGDDHRIMYETAKVIPAQGLNNHCRVLLTDQNISYLHVRYGPTDCYQFKIERLAT